MLLAIVGTDIPAAVSRNNNVLIGAGFTDLIRGPNLVFSVKLKAVYRCGGTWMGCG